MKTITNISNTILLVLLFAAILFSSGQQKAFAQNAIVGSGFTSGWGGACNSNTDFEYFGSSAGTSFISTQTANGTGNQYFRLGIDWGGTISQNTITVGSDVEVVQKTIYNLDATCTTSGAMYINVSNASDNYIFKTRNAGTNPSRELIYFRVQGIISNVSSVSVPIAVLPADVVTITASLSTSLSTGQGVYLRYTTDNFISSTIVEMSGSGTSYSADIPSGSNIKDQTVKYYVFTSGDGLSISHADADFYTINLNNNSGSNYAYTPREISWVNLHFPSDGTMMPGDDFNIYSHIYINGVTTENLESGNISAWIGYSTENTDPSTWAESNWKPASYNLKSGNNHEYVNNAKDAGLTAGTYYYASRFKYGNSLYFYGGYSTSNGGYWDGINNSSGVLRFGKNSTITGNWEDNSSWDGNVPAIGEHVYIKNGHTITLNSNTQINSLTIETGGSLIINGEYSLTIGPDGSFTNNGSFTGTQSTIILNGTSTVEGSTATEFNNITVEGLDVTLNYASTKINGILDLRAGSIFNAPEFRSGSTLRYSQGGNYDRVTEWNSPWHVQVANNTNLNLNIGNFGSDLICRGDFIIDENSTVSIDDSHTYDFYVEGNMVLNGNITLSTTAGSDIVLKGNWTRSSTSIFTPNQRAIFFTGTAEQSINSDGGETFDYVILDNGSNLNLLSNVTIKEKLEMVSGNITTNANILEIGTSTSDPGLLDYTSGMVLGTIKRWFAANTNSGDQTGIFPLGVGSDFRPVVVEYSTAPTVGGTLTASFVESSMGWQNSGSSPTIAAVGSCDAFSVTNYSDQGYWQIDDADGLSGGIYDISLYANGFTTINDICQLTALKRVGAGLWESVGQHQQPNATGDHGLQIKRRLVSGWSNWGLASGKDNILPVELIEFTHECYPNQTTILWTTASEKNNKHFEIEKSFDAYNWESIAKVDGAGNSNTKIFYSFEDPASFHSDKIVYYRLKQTDFDGTYSYSNTISANCDSKIEPFSVYPNPNNGSFTITTSNPQNKIKIFDTSGKILFDQDNHEKYEIEIEGVDLKPGVYFLNIIFDNTTYTKKIVVSP